MNEVHERIKKRLSELNLSNEAASLKAGQSRGYLRLLFRRKNSTPTLDAAERLAKALNVSPQWLLFGETIYDREPNKELDPYTMSIIQKAGDLAMKMARDSEHINIEPEPFGEAFAQILEHMVAETAEDEKINNVVDFQLRVISKQ